MRLILRETKPGEFLRPPAGIREDLCEALSKALGAVAPTSRGCEWDVVTDLAARMESVYLDRLKALAVEISK